MVLVLILIVLILIVAYYDNKCKKLESENRRLKRQLKEEEIKHKMAETKLNHQPSTSETVVIKCHVRCEHFNVRDGARTIC